MQIILFESLKEISGYKDIRSIKAWLAGLHVPLKRIGKNYAVDKIVFEQQFHKATNLNTRKTYEPKEDSEKSFLLEISHLLSRHTEL